MRDSFNNKPTLNYVTLQEPGDMESLSNSSSKTLALSSFEFHNFQGATLWASCWLIHDGNMASLITTSQSRKKEGRGAGTCHIQSSYQERGRGPVTLTMAMTWILLHASDSTIQQRAEMVLGEKNQKMVLNISIQNLFVLGTSYKDIILSFAPPLPVYKTFSIVAA